MYCEVCGSKKDINSECNLGCEKTNKAPHICPVCYGTGNVQAGFYSPYKVEENYRVWTTIGTAMEICRSCNGKGIVWG